MHMLHVANAPHLAEPAGISIDHAILPGTYLLEIELGFAECDAEVFGVLGFMHDLGNVQQGFAGNTSAVQADPAGILLQVDKGDVHAEIGCVKGCRVSAGTTTENDDFGAARFFAHD